MNRISTGVKGLDELINGGIPENDLVLLSGTCGAGKTIFGLQFLISAAKNEPGIFVSFEQETPYIKLVASNFGWDVDDLEKDGKIRFLKYDPFRLEDIMEVIENNIRELKAKRVVIDSISALGMHVPDAGELRRMIVLISNLLRKNGCTSLLISEVLNESSLSRFGVEEFVADGVILMNSKLISGEYKRVLTIWKMRLTDHSRKLHLYEIKNSGIVVYPYRTMRD